MKNIYPLLVLSCLVFLSCKRDSDKFTSIGPKYITIEQTFAVSSDPADLTKGNIFFNCSLTGKAAWQIEVRGNNSGAVKRFSGNSQQLDLSNTKWDGSSDTTIAFKSESCKATLYLPSTGVTKTISFDLVVYNGPFTITQAFAVNADPVNFSTSKEYFKAQFSNVKSWIITITGNTSGATKEIIGSSKSISLNNSTWDGSSDTAFFFRAESCTAVLSFPDTSLTQTISFTISTPKTHPGYLINDFEAAAFGTYLGSNNGNYFDATDQPTSTIDLFPFSPAPQGSKVLRFDCNDVNSSFYTGGVYHNSVASNFGIPTLDDDSLYLNFFVYGYAGGNASLQPVIVESDGDQWKTSTNVDVNWVGWKLVSIKYSSMVDNGGTGNIVKETYKINGVNLNMNSVPVNNNCKTLVDYLIFTKGKSLKP